MMATTIMSSIRVKPFCSFVISKAPLAVSDSHHSDADASGWAYCKPHANRDDYVNYRAAAWFECATFRVFRHIAQRVRAAIAAAGTLSDENCQRFRSLA